MGQEIPLIEYVTNDMSVVDGAGDTIGKVDMIRFGDSSTPPAPNPGMPDGIYERYRVAGYLHIDGKGWFDTDRWVISEQIATVSNNVVHLNVAKEDLLED